MSSTEKPKTKAAIILLGDHRVTIVPDCGEYLITHSKGHGYSSETLDRDISKRFDTAVQIAFKFLGQNLVVADQSEVPA